MKWRDYCGGYDAYVKGHWRQGWDRVNGKWVKITPALHPVGYRRKQRMNGGRIPAVFYWIIKFQSTGQGMKDWMPEHRYLMEKKLGRKLRTDEHVHHIDGDSLNNSLSNLVILTRSEHASLERRKGLANGKGFAALRKRKHKCPLCGKVHRP